MKKIFILLMGTIFLSSVSYAKQQQRPVAHAHNGKKHTHVLPNNGRGHHNHRGNHNTKRAYYNKKVAHNHNGKRHVHVLPNGQKNHSHSRPRPPQRNTSAPVKNKSKPVVVANNDRFSNNSIRVPEYFLVRTGSGCAAVNPGPVPNESIRWTGKCKNGRINGFGTLTWYKNGKKGSKNENVYYKNGFELITRSTDLAEYIIKNADCQFLMPSSYAWSNGKKRTTKELMTIKYHGECGSGKDRKASIYFNNQLFAKYSGRIYRGSLPENGMLEFFSGDVYKMGEMPSGRYIHSGMVKTWFDGAHLVKTSNKNGAGLSDNDFKIKLGFNSKAVRVNRRDGKLLGFNYRTLSSANGVTLNYNIKPKNRSKLSKKSYKMILEIKISYTKVSQLSGGGIWSALSKTFEDQTVYDYLEIELKRSNGYKSSGKKKLRKIATFLSAFGTQQATIDIKPDVKVISID